MGSSVNSSSTPPVTQAELAEKVLPLIKRASREYEKFQRVYARPATPGEIIVSITHDGTETTNTAKPDQMVVRNLTGAQEEYIVSDSTFGKRYSRIESIDDEWSAYAPMGEVMAIEITKNLIDELRVEKEFFIAAPWGSEQRVREGDMFVAPLPDLEKIYRIARKEFDETYRLKTAD